MSFREKARDCANLDHASPGAGSYSQSGRGFVYLSPVSLVAGELCLQGDTQRQFISHLLTRGRIGKTSKADRRPRKPCRQKKLRVVDNEELHAEKVRGKQMIKRMDRKLIHAATQNYRNMASTKSEKRESYYKNLEKNKTADVLTSNGSDIEVP